MEYLNWMAEHWLLTIVLFSIVFGSRKVVAPMKRHKPQAAWAIVQPANGYIDSPMPIRTMPCRYQPALAADLIQIPELAARFLRWQTFPELWQHGTRFPESW